MTIKGKDTQAKLIELDSIESKIAQLEGRRQALLADEEVKAAVSLIAELEQMLKVRGVAKEDLPGLMGLSRGEQRNRPSKTFKNPYTGEVYTGKSVARSLKAWVAEYGKAEVDKWEIIE